MYQFLTKHLTTVPIRVEGWSLVVGSLLTILIAGVCSYATQYDSWVPYAWADLGMSGAAVISNGMILVMLRRFMVLQKANTDLQKQLVETVAENGRLGREIYERDK